MTAAGRPGRAVLCLTVLLLCACATRGPRPEPALAAPVLSEAQARQLVAAWQHELSDYLARAGDGDPAVLARLPAQRATGTLRPARISFGVLDLESRLAEADGYDVQGVLLATPDVQGYVFMVGIVQREGYRPQALVDLRPVTMQLHSGQPGQPGQPRWAVGDSDAQALARYRAAIDPSVPLRFPADKDQFELVPCAPDWCVAERLTQARWVVAH